MNIIKRFSAALIVATVLLGCTPGELVPQESVAEVRQAIDAEPWDEFVENATIGIHRVLPDGTIEYANPADYVGLGYTESEYVGHNIRDFHVSQPTIEAMLTTLLNGGELVNFPAKLLRKDGSTAYVLIQSKVDFEHGHTRCFTKEVSSSIYWVRWSELN